MQDEKNMETVTSNAHETQGFGYIKYLSISIILAVICFYLGGVYRSNNLRFEYISQGEILALEKARVQAQNIKDRQLFFGKPEDAINHIEQIQKDLSKNGVIILLTDSKIYGNNVTSISKEVHKKIVDRLEVK